MFSPSFVVQITRLQKLSNKDLMLNIHFLFSLSLEHTKTRNKLFRYSVVPYTEHCSVFLVRFASPLFRVLVIARKNEDKILAV